MPELNKANRAVCDVDVRVLSTKKPFLFFDTANTTTAGLSGDSVYAMAKGNRRIAYHNPMTGTMTLEAQVYPFKLFALLTDGTIHTDAVFPVRKVVKASGGVIPISLGSNRTFEDTNAIFVYPKGYFGDEDYRILGTYSSNTFTPDGSTPVTNNEDYEIGYVAIANAGVKRITFGNDKVPQDYFITMSTLDKDEEGTLTPFLIKAYKATVQRTWELSFTSEGDPATVTVTFDLLEDKDGNIIDMIELTDEVGEATGMWTSLSKVSVKVNKNSANIGISNAVGNVTATFVNSSNVDSTSSFDVSISGDNDTIMVKPKTGTAVGDYTMTLTDSNSPTANTATVIVTVLAA